MPARDDPTSERVREHIFSGAAPDSPIARHMQPQPQTMQSASNSPAPSALQAATNSSVSDGGTGLQTPTQEEVGLPAAPGALHATDGLTKEQLSSDSHLRSASTVSTSVCVYAGFRSRMQLAVDELPLPPPLRRYLMLELD